MHRRRCLQRRGAYLGDVGSWGISGTETGDITELAPLLQRFESLTLHAGDLGLGKNLSFPELVELNLERLNLWFGMEDYGCGVGLDDLGPILSGVAFPRLKHLGLMNAEFTDEAVAALPRAHLLKQLESLDLSMGTMTDKGVDTLIANKAAFAHLTRINLDNNALTEASEEKVKSLGNATPVRSRTQSEPRTIAIATPRSGNEPGAPPRSTWSACSAPRPSEPVISAVERVRYRPSRASSP